MCVHSSLSQECWPHTHMYRGRRACTQLKWSWKPYCISTYMPYCVKDTYGWLCVCFFYILPLSFIKFSMLWCFALLLSECTTQSNTVNVTVMSLHSKELFFCCCWIWFYKLKAHPRHHRLADNHLLISDLHVLYVVECGGDPKKTLKNCLICSTIQMLCCFAHWRHVLLVGETIDQPERVWFKTWAWSFYIAGYLGS